jgi:hypothetical protein
MTAISTLTHTQIEKLINLTASSVSDNFLFRCNLVSTKYANGIFQSLIGWISFVFIGDAIVLLLLILPVIFLFHAQGKQRKMKQLYLKTRSLMLKFLVLMTFALATTPLAAWAIRTKSPCVESRKQNLVNFGFKYQCPSFNVVFAAAVAFFLFTSSGRAVSIDKELDTKIKISMFCEAYFMKIISVCFALFFMISEIIYGKSSVVQTVFSIFFGLTISSIVELIRIVDIIVIESLLVAALCVCVYFNERETIFPSQYNEFWKLCFLGIEYIVYSMLLVIKFVWKNREFKFNMRFSDFFDDDAPTTDFGEAYFGELEVTVENESDLFDILNCDIKDSALATFLKIMFDVISTVILEYVNK